MTKLTLSFYLSLEKKGMGKMTDFPRAEALTLTCYCCGHEFQPDTERENNTWNDEYICPDCTEDYYTCDDCGRYVKPENAIIVGDCDEVYCPDCARAQDLYDCEDCGHTYHESDMFWVNTPDTDYIVCADCMRSDAYIECPDCGRLVREQDVEYIDARDACLCWECAEEWRDRLCIRNWHTQKKAGVYMAFGHSNDGIFAGTEIEIDCPGEYRDEDERNEHAAALLDILREDRAVAEWDASLEAGFELITQPMTLEYMMETFRPNVEKAMSQAVQYGYRAHDTKTCGLHVHVSRAPVPLSAQYVIWKLFGLHKDNLIKLSRRVDMAQIEHYCKFPRIVNGEVEPMDIVDRYHACNFTNKHTIEYRLFRGTLKPETYLAAVQFSVGITRAAIQHGEDLLSMEWNEIMSAVLASLPAQHRSELYDHLCAKELYVPMVQEELDVTIGDVWEMAIAAN